jgi:hypothetical protein
MLADPQVVTINAVAKSLPRVGFGDRKGVFENLTTGHTFTVSHVNGKRNRNSVRLDITKTAADPLLDGVSRQYSMSCLLILDKPVVGFSQTEIEQNAQGLIDWLDTPANLTKVCGGES